MRGKRWLLALAMTFLIGRLWRRRPKEPRRLEFSSSIPLTASLQIKHTRPGFDKGRKKKRGDVVAEVFTGVDQVRDPASLYPWVHKDQGIDRGQDMYKERIVAPDGTILRNVEESLSDHYGHGSAKFKLDSAADQPEATSDAKQTDAAKASG